MAFDKLIIKSITGAAKNGIKLDLALDSAREKLIDVVADQINDNIPIPLPFTVKSVVLGDTTLSPNLLTPEYVNELPSIPENEKQQILTTLDRIEATVNTAIVQKNSLQQGLSTITSPLTTLESLADTVGGVITGVKAGVTTIKLLPFPTSVPPGIGIPVNIINGFADSLDTLGTLLNKFGGSLEIIPKAVGEINKILTPLVSKFNILDSTFEKILQIIAFIRLLLKQPITQTDVDQVKQDIAQSLQESLALNLELITPGNTTGNGEVISFPLIYRGFVLTEEFDPENTFSFPARRIKAENKAKVILYSIPPDQGSGVVNTKSTYSYSSSTQVLINEVKFNIDQYLLKNPSSGKGLELETSVQTAVTSTTTGTVGGTTTSGTSGTQSTPGYVPFGEPGTASGEVRFQGGQAWRYLGGSQDKWVEHTTNLNPVGRKGVYDGEEYILRNNPPEPYPRSTYKWSDLFYAWMYQGTQTGAV